MRILFIGDVFARAGRRAVTTLVPQLREQHAVDLVLANADNARHGHGIDLESYEELRAAGIEWLTGGNHVWDVREFYPLLDDPKIHVLRPANYPAGAPGRGVATISVNGETVTLIHLMGQVFMNPPQLENPFLMIEELLKKAQGFTIVDFHGEATSEKNNFGHFVDGRVGAVVGTHTHVQTADDRLLPNGTAYITDIGMTGPLNGSIGVSLETVLPAYLKGLPIRMEPAAGPIQFSAVLIEVVEGKAVLIERIHTVLDE